MPGRHRGLCLVTPSVVRAAGTRPARAAEFTKLYNALLARETKTSQIQGDRLTKPFEGEVLYASSQRAMGTTPEDATMVMEFDTAPVRPLLSGYSRALPSLATFH
jgi:hypothetical protein